jgi:heme/copper-type cytochrome/quinol oxidase subunit 3
VIAGYPIIATYGASESSTGISKFEVFILATMILFGALIAAVFWLIVRPDRRASPAHQPND